MRGRRIEQLRLTAREEASPPATAAPGTNAAAAPKPPSAPTRYVEFELTAVRAAGPLAAASVEEKKK